MILPLIGEQKEFHSSTSLRTSTSYGYLIKYAHFWEKGNINMAVMNLLTFYPILAILSNSSYLTSKLRTTLQSLVFFVSLTYSFCPTTTSKISSTWYQ